ncbi:MAG: PTS sugar transporter subunit IIA [Treponema sp.]|jgi:lichenan operon transcriptional antiterminator|nr:PTS sugar transporter subunit IIA [Treponema sp.]
MDRNYRILLNAMLQLEADWITAAALSLHMNVSVRSVKKYVGELNALYEGLVSSSRKGYRVDRGRAKELLASGGSRAPFTPNERIRYILKQLLAAPRGSLDLYRICEDEVFVSLETAKKDLSAVRKQLAQFDMYITTAGFTITLEGSELDKRKMLSNILYEEFSESVLSLTAIEKVFPRYNIQYVYNAILDICKRHHFFVNEYSLLTLVLDIVISIDRIKNDFALPGKPCRCGGRTPERLLAREITGRIETYFGITYNDLELNELTGIITGNLVKTDSSAVTMENIRGFVDPACAALIEPVKALLSSYDFVDVANDAFMSRFILHLNNLLTRLKTQYVRKNPLTAHIKTSCPMIFECAVSLSDLINRKTGFRISEHETAYIALHIGSLLSTHLSMRDKVICALLFPGYYDYGERLITRLTGAFASLLVIQHVFTRAEELESLEEPVDLVISVVNVPDFYKAEFVCVNPFMVERDLEAVQSRVEKIRQQKKKRRLFEQLRQMSGPELFSKNIFFASGEDAICYMSGLMIKNGYAEESFCEEVLARERSYSTAYGNIAIPHSMQMNAKKTGMSVLINEKPVPWGQSMVNIVLLFSIQKETRNLFYDILNNLIVLLLEAPNAAKIVNCSGYEDFIGNIMECL